PRADRQGRIAAIEILKSTARTREYMEHGEREGKPPPDRREQGDPEGMQTFDGVLEKYVRQGLVKKEDAMAYATNPGNFLLRLSDMGAAGAQSPPPPPPPRTPPPRA